MTRLVFAGIGAVALAFVWMFWSLHGERERGTRVADARIAPSDPETDPDVDLAVPVSPEVPDPSTSIARTQTIDERPAISGRVLGAIGALAAEERVVAMTFVGRRDPHWDSRRLTAAVASDGSFSLRVPVDTRYALLDLEGPFLYLAEAVKALPGEEVRLEPEVLGVIEGRVLPPLGLTPAEREHLTETKIACISVTKPAIVGLDGDSRTQPDADGSFEMQRVPVGIELVLRVKHPFGPDQEQRIAALVPGERRELVIALDPGLTISGRVLDEYGRPVEGAHVSHGTLDAGLGWGDDDPTTDAAGAFSLVHLERKEWRVCAGMEGLAQTAQAVIDGVAGDVSDLVLTLPRGGCIGGTVAWANGEPAEDFTVLAIAEGSHGILRGKQGQFLLCGLEKDVHRVQVRASRKGVEGRAEVTDVRVGETSLHFVLEATSLWSLRGSVVNRENEPVGEFRVAARGSGGGRGEHGSSGTFVLDRLRAGETTVTVGASGYRDAEQRVLIGPDTGPLRFVLERAGVVRGRVLDPEGNPVAGASIVEGEGPWSLFDSTENGMSDASGRFELPVSSNDVRLQASHDGFAPSELVAIRVDGGAVLDDIVLRLKETCRLTGRVLDVDGRPLLGVLVRVGSRGSSTTSDRNGEFAFEGVPAGTATIRAWSHPKGGEEKAALVDLQLAPGDNSVELRLESADPVRLHGRITRHGEPVVSSLWLYAWGSPVTAKSGADGRFEATLPHPGACKGWIVLGEKVSANAEVHSFEIVVPDVDEHELALELDGLPVSSVEEIGY